MVVKLTTIIPVFNPDKDRKRNLEFVYERLKQFETNIVIAVQSSCVDNYYSLFHEAKVTFVNAPTDNFNKSFIFNYCMSLVETNFIMLLDSDIYFDFKNLLNEIVDEDEIIKPFDECIYLNEEMTREFVEKKHVVATPDLKRVSALGGGSIIIRKDLIEKYALRYDENFSGWGAEDLDFGDQLRSKGLKIRTIPQPAAHLYHNPSKSENKNFVYYNNKTKIKSKIVHVFNCCSLECDYLNSYVKNRNADILLMNCGDMDYLNNDNFRFSFVEKESLGYNLVSVIKAAFPFLEDDGWVLYTKFSYNPPETIYYDLLNSQVDYIPLHEAGRLSGFAVRKRRWPKDMPKIYAESEGWEEIVAKLN
jgi:hypothetical protein